METLRVTTHSGEDTLIQVEGYDPLAIEQKMNDNEVQAIAIGSNVYSRIDLKNIMKIVDQ
ncbi:hypothetical protein [Virgibacillus sp. Bac332]|uniref:hypothetical protein n=1 Tax=Virgibacillus sp. Bac332 TaxID=2419842 RepID=UPI000EF46260|nr:hypothetical protein [Virgibacillus sp. Bac332]